MIIRIAPGHELSALGTSNTKDGPWVGPIKTADSFIKSNKSTTREDNEAQPWQDSARCHRPARGNVFMHSGWPSVGGHDGSGRSQAVDGRADDPAGVPGPLAAGVESVDCGALPGDWIAEDADGGAAAGLGAGEGGMLEEATVEPPIHDGQSADERLGDLLREAGVQIGGEGVRHGNSSTGAGPGWAGPGGSRGPTGWVPRRTVPPAR